MAFFEIRNTAIKNPSAFKIERFNVTNMERLADSTMTGDLIARKRKFYFTYDVITGSDLNNILNLIWEASGLFFLLKYYENGVAKTATVYVGAIPSDLYRADLSTNWVWRNVTFNLIEQ